MCDICKEAQRKQEARQQQSRWTTSQQPPKPGREDVLSYVLRSLPKDAAQVKIGLIEREQMGKAKYGTVLQTENGRDPLVDALQETADLVMYLGQAVLEAASTPSGGRYEQKLRLLQSASELLHELEELPR